MNAPIIVPFVKTPGKCAQLHTLWATAAAAAGVAILPRKDAVAMGESQGFNPATCRTQFQVMFKKMQAPANIAPPVETPTEPPATQGDKVGEPSLTDLAAPQLTRAQKRAAAKLAAANEVQPA